MHIVRVAAVTIAAALLLGASPVKYPGHPATSPEIKGADILVRDKAIADDAFEGRGPGTVNGEASAQWITVSYTHLTLPTIYSV